MLDINKFDATKLLPRSFTILLSFGYLPSTGTDEAKQAIADYCASNGENISVQVSKLRVNFLFFVALIVKWPSCHNVKI